VGPGALGQIGGSTPHRGKLRYVTDFGPLVRSVLAIQELSLRRDWLCSYVGSQPLAGRAIVLNGLCEAAECGEPRAREALVALVVLLARDGQSPWVVELRERATRECLSSIGRLLRHYPLESETITEDTTVPDYGVGRELTLGERRSLARRPHRAAFDKLLMDPHPLVLEQLLGNPRLTELDVVRIAARRPAHPSTMRQLSTFSGWLVRTRVRLTLIHNPGAPCTLVVPLIALCTRQELREIVQDPTLHPVARSVANELFERRPPLGPVDSAELQ